MDWYIEQAGEVAGPFSTSDASERLRGMGDPGALVWRDGMDGWGAASLQAEFSTLFPKRPPPLPSRAPPPLPASEYDATPTVRSPVEEPFELAPAPPIVPGSPWSRYFARQIDMLYLGFGGIAALSLALAAYSPSTYRSFSTINGGLLGVLGLVLATALNAIVISIFGNSLGKKMFGLVAVPNDIRARPSVLWVAAREFRVWVYGLAMGFPFVTIWTASRNHAEVKAGRPAYYDRGTATVLESPISGARRAFGMVFALALIVASFITDIWARVEETKTASTKPWVNPVTMLTAQIPSGWNIDATNSNPASQLYAFATGDGMEAVFIGAETLPGAAGQSFDVERYGLGLEQSLANTVTFNGRWTVASLNGRSVLIRRAEMKEEGWPATYAIWQEGRTFWRIMALSAVSMTAPQITDMPIARQLAASVPRQQ